MVKAPVFGCLFLFLSIFFHGYLWAVVWGSETEVSVLPLVTFPVLDVDNTMLGFGWFKNGVTLEDSSTTCTFQSVYPVSGALALNGGALYLQEDFIMTNTASITGGGQIVGNNHMVQFCSTVTSLSSTYTFRDAFVTLGADTQVTGQLVFEGDCYLAGRFFHMDLSAGSVVVAADSKLICDDIYFDNVQESNIACANNSSQIVMHDTRLLFTDHFHFSAGSIQTFNDVDFRGSCSFIYDSPCTSTISAGSTLSMKDGMLFEVGRYNGNEPLNFESKDTSILNFQDSSLLVTDSGMQLVAGRITVDGDITVDSSSTSTELGLIFGNGIADGDMNIVLNSGASIKFNSGWLVYNNVLPDRFFATSKNARAIRYANSKTYIKNNWTFPEMTLVVAGGQPATLLDVDKALSYDKAHLVFENVEFDFTGSQFGDSLFAMNGNGLLFLTKGTYQPYLSVSGTGNMLWGSGDMAGPIVFADSGSQLTCNLNGSILYDIALGGGTIILANDFYLGPQNTLLQTGTIDFDGHRCEFGTEDQMWTSTLIWKNGSISFNSHIILYGTWTFEDDCVVYGGGNMLDLDGAGSIVIADGATVTFRNIRIRGISGTQIQCLGDSSALILDDVVWEQDGDTVFPQGKIQWVHDVIMRGCSTFAYQSGQISTVLYESSLILDPGFTFRYAPSTGSKILLALEDQTSKLVLNGGTLHTAATGIQLTKGNIQVLRESYLAADATAFVAGGAWVHSDAGVTLGNGVVSDDVVLDIYSGVTLRVESGSVLSYNNIDPTSLYLHNGSSALYIGSGAALELLQPMNIGSGVLTFGGGATLARIAGQVILGSVQPLGTLAIADIV